MRNVQSLCFSTLNIINLLLLISNPARSFPLAIFPRFRFDSIPCQCASRLDYTDYSYTIVKEDDIAKHLGYLNQSLIESTGRSLFQFIQEENTDDPPKLPQAHDPSTKSPALHVWLDQLHMNMRYALISHGTDRNNNYANFGALAAFSYPKTQILRVAADSLARNGSDQLALSRTYDDLKQWSAPKNVITQYAGFRCTQDQRVFYIRDAIIWNCYNESKHFIGQATIFDRQKIEFMS